MIIVDIGPNQRSIDGFAAFRARQQRQRSVLIRRLHVPWRMRKYEPERASDLEREFTQRYAQRAQLYMRSAL